VGEFLEGGVELVVVEAVGLGECLFAREEAAVLPILL
jgi:hypothetical protein